MGIAVKTSTRSLVRAKRELLEQAAKDYAAAKLAKPGALSVLEAASELERAALGFAKVSP